MSSAENFNIVLFKFHLFLRTMFRSCSNVAANKRKKIQHSLVLFCHAFDLMHTSLACKTFIESADQANVSFYVDIHEFLLLK